MTNQTMSKSNIKTRYFSLNIFLSLMVSNDLHRGIKREGEKRESDDLLTILWEILYISQYKVLEKGSAQLEFLL